MLRPELQEFIDDLMEAVRQVCPGIYEEPYLP
jgi:hypothetical protein